MGFNFLDWVIVGYLALWAIMVLTGLRRGFVREAMTMVGLVFGFLLANRWAEDLAAALNRQVSPSGYWPVIAFIAIFVVTFVVAVVLGRLVHRLFDFAALGWLNRLAGGLFGLCKGALIGLVAVFAVSFFLSADSRLVKQSKLAPRVHQAVNRVYDLVPDAWRGGLAENRRKLKGYIDRNTNAKTGTRS